MAYTDGASSHNQNADQRRGGWGIVLTLINEQGEPDARPAAYKELSGTLPGATNNQAEYHALVAGLEWCKQRDVREVIVRLDSLLVVNQMKGIFKVKNRELWTLYETAKKYQATFRKISFTHVPRELNKQADAEVNKALDAISGKDVVQ